MGERGTGVAAANWGHVFTNWINGKGDQASAVESAARALIAALGPKLPQDGSSASTGCTYPTTRR